MNYLYNGVELPDINTVWTDKVTYPNVTIFVSSQKNFDTGLTETYTYLWFLDNPPYVGRSDGIAGSLYGGAIIQSYRLTGGNWEYYATHTWPSAFSYPFDYIIWTNYDLLDEDGNLILSASSPIPVSTFTPDPMSLTMGWIVGRRIAGQRGKKKEPVAYLYNGVRLPKLPEWDRDMYPWAVIQYVTITTPAYRLLVSQSPTVLNASLTGGSTPAPGLIWTAGDTWGEPISNDSGQTWVNCDLIWANYDVYYSGGETLALAASDPVPVYES